MNIKKKGFTLIELLAVIVILSILVVLVVPKVTDILRTSKQKTYETNKEVIEKAAKGYILDHPEETEVSLQTLLDDNLLDTIPIDPRTNEEMDGYLVLYDGKGDYKTGDYSDGYNSPELSKNMYPVKWNGTAWQVTNKDDVDWYLYNGDIDNSGDTNKDDGQGAFTADKWANAHITTELLSEGDTIEEIDLNLYVWIPRYTYLLDEPTKTIQVKYTQGINDDNSSNYLSHPGFTFGDKELTGIWVAKFEMSYDKDKTDSQGGTYTTGNDYIFMSRPNSGTDPARGSAIVELKETNIISRNISVNDIFEESRELEEEYLINADTHMIKSSEWGAVAYLTEAIRDGEEVWINNQGTYDNDAVSAGNDSYYYYYRDYITGCTEGPTKNFGANEDAICSNPYNSIQGQKGSTTGNLYGIYDMSGGLWEYNAIYLEDNPNTTTYDSRYTSTSYMKSLANAENKYKENLEVDVNNPYADSNQNSRDNYLYYTNTNGLALHEISTEGTGVTSWYVDYSYYLNEYLPAVLRGGLFSSGSYAGVFAFMRDSGNAYVYNGWRGVVVL